MLLGANESNVVQKYLEESLHAAKMEADRLREELKTAQASIPEGMGLEELEKFALSGVLRVIKNVSGASSGKFLAPKKVAEISVRAYRVCLEGRAKGLCQAEIIEQMDRIA